jgi:hypothetical protein
VADRFRTEVEEGRVQIHRQPSADALAALAENSVDFVYVDGDHTREGCLADLNAAYRITKIGGYIGGDDYNLGGWWKDGVVRAVHEFAAAHDVVFDFVMGSQFLARKVRAS